MKIVVQRVSRASVRVKGEIVGSIGRGLLLLVGVETGDGPEQVARAAHRLATLRVFEDEHGHMNRGLDEVGGEILVVSQFTLYADCRHGRRPSFTDAAQPELARLLIEEFVRMLQAEGVQHVANGAFGAHMLVEIHNDGPVTIMLDSDDL